MIQVRIVKNGVLVDGRDCRGGCNWGVHGVDWAAGADRRHGVDGAEAADGVDGADGADGGDAADGVDETDGADGADKANSSARHGWPT